MSTHAHAWRRGGGRTDVKQREVGVDELEAEGLGNEVVLELRLGSVVFHLVQVPRNAAIDKVQQLRRQAG